MPPLGALAGATKLINYAHWERDRYKAEANPPPPLKLDLSDNCIEEPQGDILGSTPLLVLPRPEPCSAHSLSARGVDASAFPVATALIDDLKSKRIKLSMDEADKEATVIVTDFTDQRPPPPPPMGKGDGRRQGGGYKGGGGGGGGYKGGGGGTSRPYDRRDRDDGRRDARRDDDRRDRDRRDRDRALFACICTNARCAHGYSRGSPHFALSACSGLMLSFLRFARWQAATIATGAEIETVGCPVEVHVDL